MFETTIKCLGHHEPATEKSGVPKAHKTGIAVNYIVSYENNWYLHREQF